MIVVYLVEEAGARLDACDAQGRMPLMLAMKAEHMEVAALILQLIEAGGM